MPVPRDDGEQFWRDTLADWKHSGLSVIEYCRVHRLTPSRFHHWKSKFVESAAATKTANRLTSIA